MKTTTAEQLVAYSKLIVDKKAPVEQSQKILDKGLLSDLLDADIDGIDRDAFRKMCGLVALNAAVEQVAQTEAVTSGILVVDYSLNLQQMIAAGKYDWVNSDITEKRYPVRPEGQVAEKVEYEYLLDHPNRDISTNDELERITKIDKNNPWQVAETPHLLAYGAAHPEDQRKFPIIGLGSVALVYGRRVCPCLVGDDSRRGLGLFWVGGLRVARCRFLLVRRKKVSVASAS